MWKYIPEILAGVLSTAVIIICWKQYDVIDQKRRKDILIMAAVGILLVLLNLFMGNTKGRENSDTGSDRGSDLLWGAFYCMSFDKAADWSR